MVKIYLAEDQVMIAQALQMLLELEDDFEVIGIATDGKTALKDILDTKPDVVLLDIEMPGLTGLEVADQLALLGKSVRVIILTTFARQKYFDQAIKAQVAGYLLKDSPSEILISAIKAVLVGQTVYESRLVQGMFAAETPPLTKRELEILQVMRSATTTKEIAERVFLAEGTVRNYISAILSKTGTATRLEAVMLAQKNGWI
ncbi:MAG: response regulator transcription factor [Ligilactobacillus animalis]|uniref:response regulator transcription factor n=1 Tax=Ligilactobacillus animalis TaxID=1605 RepID=UPI00242DEAA5|nr:response regulator transcription factor [Ligilactobacillus animalis]MCI5943011.1 response regulator transcription factor [Ligilactobacillus animalis]MDY2993234.1 response regulator transcription factor [Ligilactobacillus animalis]